MTQDELIVIVKRELKGLADEFEADNFTDASDEAVRDTGWAFPVSTAFRILWLKKRTKRHLYEMKRDDTAEDFHAKNYHMNQKFEHYRLMIKDADAEFILIQESRPEEFADVDSYKMFGTKIDAGFAYDGVGNDMTYHDDQLVAFDPTE